MEREKREHALVSGRREEHVEKQQCLLHFEDQQMFEDQQCLFVFQLFGPFGPVVVTHCGRVCCYGVRQGSTPHSSLQLANSPREAGEGGVELLHRSASARYSTA